MRTTGSRANTLILNDVLRLPTSSKNTAIHLDNRRGWVILHAVRGPESVEAARLAGSTEKQAPRAIGANALRIYKSQWRTAALLAAEIL